MDTLTRGSVPICYAASPLLSKHIGADPRVSVPSYGSFAIVSLVAFTQNILELIRRLCIFKNKQDTCTFLPIKLKC